MLRYGVRLIAPALLTMLAFPQFILRLIHELDGVSKLAALLLAIAAAFWMVGGAAPKPAEPDVHDRQVDLILALPLLALSVWFERGWSLVDPVHAPVTAHQVLAVTSFLAGATVLLLGTRVAARWRWAISAPLLLLPWFDLHRGVQLGVLTLLALTAMAGPSQVRQWPPEGAEVNGGGARQRLPRPASALLCVAAVAVLMSATVMVSIQHAESGADRPIAAGARGAR